MSSKAQIFLVKYPQPMSAKRTTPTPGSVSVEPDTQPVNGHELPKCAKCGGPREGKATWCRDCRAKYQREYTAQAAQIAANRGFEVGVRTFRLMMAMEFARRGKIHFSGAEVAFAIEHAPRPSWPESILGTKDNADESGAVVNGGDEGRDDLASGVVNGDRPVGGP